MNIFGKMFKDWVINKNKKELKMNFSFVQGMKFLIWFLLLTKIKHFSFLKHVSKFKPSKERFRQLFCFRHFCVSNSLMLHFNSHDNNNSSFWESNLCSVFVFFKSRTLNLKIVHFAPQNHFFWIKKSKHIFPTLDLHSIMQLHQNLIFYQALHQVRFFFHFVEEYSSRMAFNLSTLAFSSAIPHI